MRGRYLHSTIMVAIAAAAVGAVISMSMTQTSGQAQQVARPATVGGKPNFSGIWQANNEANWDLQAHAAPPAAVTHAERTPRPQALRPSAPRTQERYYLRAFWPVRGRAEVRCRVGADQGERLALCAFLDRKRPTGIRARGLLRDSKLLPEL